MDSIFEEYHEKQIKLFTLYTTKDLSPQVFNNWTWRCKSKFFNFTLLFSWIFNCEMYQVKIYSIKKETIKVYFQLLDIFSVHIFASLWISMKSKKILNIFVNEN